MKTMREEGNYDNSDQQSVLTRISPVIDKTVLYHVTGPAPNIIISCPFHLNGTTGSQELEMGKEIQARTVLWYLTFAGFAVNYMLRINLNITIVDMVRAQTASSKNVNITKCYDNEAAAVPGSSLMSLTHNNQSTISGNLTDETFILERSLFRMFGMFFEENGFVWNEHERNLLLGSFYWLHWVTQIPGGILARKYGTKIVFGLSNLIGCLLCVPQPLAAYLSFESLLAIRIIQGLIAGLAWPSMHTMAGRWIPPNERSKFVTSYLGSSIGVAITFPLFGFVISWSSWEWVFHICGVIGVLWYLAWYYFVYDSPAEHPRISMEERNYIEKSLGSSAQKDAGPIPWKAILTSAAVWMTIVAQWGGIWGVFTLLVQAPTYLKLIHDLPIEWTGILSGIPHLMRMLFALGFSMFGDYMLRTNKLSRTNVRKLAGFFCAIVNGVFMLLLAYSGCNTTAAIVFLTLANMSHGAVSTGPLANIVDISPNHAGVLLGISGMIGVLPGFISPIIVGFLTNNNQTVEQWKTVFIIAASMLIGTGLLYVTFADANLKSWNSPTQIRRIGNEAPDNLEPLLQEELKAKIEMTPTVPSITSLEYVKKADK